MYSENVAFWSYTSVLVINYKNIPCNIAVVTDTEQLFNIPVHTAVLEHYLKRPL